MKLFHKKEPQSNNIATLLQHIKKQPRHIYKKLNDEAWSNAHDEQQQILINQIKNNDFLNEWTLEIEKISKPGDKIIEIGCALGASSLYLAKRNRIVTGLDYSKKMCKTFANIANDLNLKVNTVCADITKKLPLPDNFFNIVWHAGVLEHFSNQDAQFIINENARISNNLVISMVPNAASIAYRIGKEIAERTNSWNAGEENPKYTQKDLFIYAGLTNIKEYTIDLPFALAFLPASDLKKSLSDIYMNLPTQDNIHQGYLLVTIGEKQCKNQ